MLAGRVPFEGDSSVAIAMQHVSDQAPPLRALAPDVPESLALVVAHAMLKDPAQRYGSADEFSSDLDRVRRGLVPLAATAAFTAVIPREQTEVVPAVEATRIAPRPEGATLLSGDKPPARPTPRKRSRWPWLLVLLLLLAVGALAAFAIGGVPGDESSSTTGVTTTGPVTTAIAAHKLDDLEGKTYQEARATLSGYQLGLIIPKAQPVRDATHAANIVVASVPDTGAVLHRGDTVRLKVSRGQMSIPNIVGATQADAQAKLGPNFRFSPMSESKRQRSTGAASPAPMSGGGSGTTVPVGSPVTVYISTGPATVEVPKLVGRSESDARATLGRCRADRPRTPG